MKNKHAQELGKLGGKKSVESRFKGLTSEQKSELMRKVRLGYESEKDKGILIKHLQEVGQIQ